MVSADGAHQGSPTRAEGVPALAVHLLPVGEHGRLPVRRLEPLSGELASHGLAHGLFDDAEPLRVDSTDESASAFQRSSGITVRRDGARSAWTALPGGGGSALVEDVVPRLENLMTALLALDLPVPDHVAPSVGLEALDHVRADAARSATVTAGETFSVTRLRAAVHDVTAELGARLVSAVRREVR
ncbi:hypothetical protein [Umezawaea sp.]|uniref:hypothetical protein n=1 Tax=Umezawaea sp. TaxID=1955258 RepID=UPI002ED071F3